MDNQEWANWFAITIPWGAPATMSGGYVIEEDFLLSVDPDTSVLSDPDSVCEDNWGDHDREYGLGEFFDAGDAASDRKYCLTLSVDGDDTWGAWYDAARDQVHDGGSEDAILAGTVTSSWNRGGYFYGVLEDDDQK